jgi:hypothetical protein
MPINEGQLTDEKRGKKVPMHPKRNKQITNAKNRGKRMRKK